VRRANERLCDLASVLRRLSDIDVFDEEGERRPLHRRQPDDPAPTPEDIGRLFGFGLDIQSYLQETEEAANTITGETTLRNLDFVRHVIEFDKTTVARA
jgi:hypothetical protein